MGFDALQKAALLEQHMPLVHRLARQICARLTANVELDDLIQTGMIGLMDALQRHEDSDGAFEGYACLRIRGAIYDDLREKDHLPRAVRQLQRQFEKIRQRLAHSLGRKPSDAEMAAAMDMDLEQFNRARSQFQQAALLSLNEYDEADADGSSAGSWIDRVAEPTQSSESTLEEAQRQQGMRQMLQTLPERDQLILRLYFEQEMTFKEIGGIMGVNESRIYQIHSAALKGLKDQAAEHLQSC